MKTLHTSFLILIIQLSILNSVNAQKSAFEFAFHNEKKLPALVTDIDKEMLSQAYQSDNFYSSSRYYDEGEKHEYHETYMYNLNNEVNDAFQLLNRYIRDELTEDSQDNQGRIEAIVTYYDFKKSGSPVMFMNIVTFGISMFMGIPTTKYTTRVEIEFMIYNENDELKKKVYAIGTKKYHAGIYSRKNQRDLNIIAVKKAINSANEQIQADFDGLYLQLSDSAQ